MYSGELGYDDHQQGPPEYQFRHIPVETNSMHVYRLLFPLGSNAY
jgi:hypothetical protein